MYVNYTFFFTTFGQECPPGIRPGPQRTPPMERAGAVREAGQERRPGRRGSQEGGRPAGEAARREQEAEPVSYTHLTLPTILLV